MVARVEEIHLALVAAGWVGKRLPKRQFEAYLCRELGLSVAVSKFYIQTGDRLGLWVVVDLPNGRGLLIKQRSPEETHSPLMIDGTA